MEYKKSLIILFGMCLCVCAKHWYLANGNGSVEELFKPHNIKNDDKIKKFNPTKSDDHTMVPKNINFTRTHNDILPNVSELKRPSMKIFNLLKAPRRTTRKDIVKLVNNLPESNFIELNKRNTGKPKYTQNTEIKKYLTSNSMAQSRFLDIFEVVEFDHASCFSADGLEGTCLHEYDCQKIGGDTMGTCADGYGTCCVIRFTCDGYSSSSSVWFTNPGYPTPSSDRLSCTFTLHKYSDQVQQIRLDFLSFEILPPTAGKCERDQFLVTGQNVNSVVPIICGINTGQHIYVECSETEGPIALSFQTITEEKRLFSIKVTQIISSDNLRAPSGCLQFFKDDHGHLESFNYRDTSQIGITRSPSYMNNLNYAICIERAKASCSITYNNVGNMQIVNYDTEGLSLIPPRQAGVEIFDCPSDWLLISALRLCGERLNDGSILQDFTSDAPVTGLEAELLLSQSTARHRPPQVCTKHPDPRQSTSSPHLFTDDGAGPIVLWFRSDGIYAGRGFKLYYQQNSCTI